MKMLIGGEWRDAADGAVMEIRNPATGELVDTVPAAGEADALAAVQFAQEGRQAMAATPAHLRHDALMSVAARIERDIIRSSSGPTNARAPSPPVMR